MFVDSVMPSSHLILCRPLLLPSSTFPSIWVFSSGSVLHIRWPKYCSFSISPSIEYSGLTSFRMDCFDSPYCPKDSQESSPTPQFDNSCHPKHPHLCNHLCIICSNFLTGCLLTMTMSVSVIHTNYTYFSIVFLLVDLLYILLLQFYLCSVASIQHTVTVPSNECPPGAIP